MKAFRIVVVGVMLVLLVGWSGFRIPTRPLADVPRGPVEPQTIAVPDGLPAPVERFYREVYGDEIPVIDSAIISGRGSMRVSGLTLPVRWRFIHATGRDYRHHIEVTWFGARVLTIHETFLDGSARLELPVGVSEGPEVDQGANLALWAEAIWMPAVWVTDPQVRWAPVDDHTALLHVPGPEGDEVFVARFSPDTGLLTMFESMRFKGEDADVRTLWLNEAASWGELDGWLLPIETTVTWQDDGSPWAVLTTENVVYNADIDGYVDGTGP
jgi:hypothetical protein